MLALRVLYPADAPMAAISAGRCAAATGTSTGTSATAARNSTDTSAAAAGTSIGASSAAAATSSGARRRPRPALPSMPRALPPDGYYCRVARARSAQEERICWRYFTLDPWLVIARAPELTALPAVAHYWGVTQDPMRRWSGLGDASHSLRWNRMHVLCASFHAGAVESHLISWSWDHCVERCRNVGAGNEGVATGVLAFVYICTRPRP